MAFAVRNGIMCLNAIASNNFKLHGSRLWVPFSFMTVKFYCNKTESPSDRTIIHESMFVKKHLLKNLEKKREIMGLEEPKAREKIEHEVINVDWKFVEKLIPPKTVPNFPKFAKYPSGWQPPNIEKSKSLPYNVRRTRTLDLPVFFLSKNGLTRHLTKVCYIEGDIWAFEKDLREHLEKVAGSIVPTQIHEVANFVLFRGDFYKEAVFWLTDKGF